jgi:hypothetical protein
MLLEVPAAGMAAKMDLGEREGELEDSSSGSNKPPLMAM